MPRDHFFLAGAHSGFARAALCGLPLSPSRGARFDLYRSCTIPVKMAFHRSFSQGILHKRTLTGSHSELQEFFSDLVQALLKISQRIFWKLSERILNRDPFKGYRIYSDIVKILSRELLSRELLDLTKGSLSQDLLSSCQGISWNVSAMWSPLAHHVFWECPAMPPPRAPMDDLERLLGRPDTAWCWTRSKAHKFPHRMTHTHRAL